MQISLILRDFAWLRFRGIASLLLKRVCPLNLIIDLVNF